ncbi:MAG: sugar phosphate isomerase/epimerase family protein [Syntrophobacter sp.]
MRIEHEPDETNPEKVTIDSRMRAVLARAYINMPWAHLPRHIGLVLEYGMNVEIGFGARELECAPVSEIAKSVGMLRDRGCRITVHGPFWDLCPGSIDSAVREVARSRLGQLFETLEHVRPDQIVCHTGFDPRHHRGHRAAWIENSIAAWEFFAGQAERIGAPLLLENVWEEDPALHLELFRAVGSPWLGFCLDTGHQNAFSRTSLASWLESTAPYLKEVHLHDNDGSFDHHLPMGRGNIDFDYLFRFLGAHGLRPLVTLEPHKVEHLYESLQALSRMESFFGFL